MSDWLRYVPTDPQYQPTAVQDQAAKRLLASFFTQAEEVRSEFTESVVFIDSAANWSDVHCPSCGTDAVTWWQEAMSSAAEENFATLTLSAPCCGNHVSLNEMLWPSAFGRYVLEAMKPKEEFLSQQQSELLAAALGCTVREVPVHVCASRLTLPSS